MIATRHPNPFITTILLLVSTTLVVVDAAVVRSYNFDARVKHVPLLRSLPSHTAIYHQWPPKSRKDLPNYIAAAVVTESGEESEDSPLVGPPIHVQVGDKLKVTLKNSLQTTGLSLHWHGFEMTNALEYDGVVGVTQCPVAPDMQFVYEFEVDETPGSYWWHTHSGPLGLHAINSIHGPLIVHAKGEEKKQLVDKLNDALHTSAEIKNRWYYENERILFFKDGFTYPEALHLVNQMGGLNEAVSKDDSGLTVSSSAWEFGTCNGRMREIVPVSPGKTYKFRLINGGVHHVLRINIADLEMKIIAADSEPVEPIRVNEVFLHVAERFDVEVRIPDDWEPGEAFWIRADTVESAYQGYQNGIRAIMKVSSGDDDSSDEAYDPTNDNILSIVERSQDHLIMNCFDREKYERSPYTGKCLDISTLSHKQPSLDERNASYSHGEEAVVHTIDAHFQPYPQHSHFIRFDNGYFIQHVNPMKAMLDPSFGPEDMHPHTAVLHVPAYSTVLLVWRSTTLMDHPMHLHGLKMEIIKVVLPNQRQDCTLAKCKLSSFYKSHDEIRALAASIPPRTSVLKDTFILPAGGAVVTRIYTQEPSLWYAHCHLEMHHFDGMAFILNVGNYSGYGRVLPQDFPSCESPFLQARAQYPHCTCYKNPNAVLSSYITADYKCSRDHLCHHVHSRVANLERYHFVGGDSIHSAHEMSGWAISLICLALALVCFIACSKEYRRISAENIGFSLLTLRQFLNPLCNGKSITRSNPLSNPSAGESSSERLDRLHSDSNSTLSRQIAATDNGVGSTVHSYRSSDDSQVQEHTAIPARNLVDRSKYQSRNIESADEQDSSSSLSSCPSEFQFTKQLNDVIREQYTVYRPLCISSLRMIEVCSLAMLTGALHYDVGNDTSFTGLSQRVGLFFFSTTLWTFTRMYPSVDFAHQWCISIKEKPKKKHYTFGPIVSGRILVVLSLESFWPMIYVLVCYPFAGVFGSAKIVILVGLFLLLNNLCYVSLGAVNGVYSNRVQQGMIASTILSQMSLVAAGFYTKLPPALFWIRYVSPFYWSFRGIVKSCFAWNDTLECFKGSSEVGPNQCYLEYHAVIDQYKERGINVATYNDPSSNSVFSEFVALLFLLVFLNFLIYVKFWYMQKSLQQD